MDRLTCLQAIADLSEEMLAAARTSKWDSLQALEAKERGLLALLRSLTSLTDIGRQKNLTQTILDNHSAIATFIQPLHHDLKMLLEALPERVRIST